jgi:hypothetical protein
MHWTEVLRQRAVSSGDNGMCKSISSIARHNLAADHLYVLDLKPNKHINKRKINEARNCKLPCHAPGANKYGQNVDPVIEKFD